MASPQEANKNIPDVQALWVWNDDTMQFAERAYRTWLQGAETIQSQALDFWNTELQKGLDAMNQIAKCQTAAEAFGVRTRYATEAMQGLFAEGQKVIDQLTTFTKTPFATATLVPRQEAPSTRANGNGGDKSRSSRRASK